MATSQGTVRVLARITGIRPGVLFLPFHDGYWDTGGGYARLDEGRAANEPTPTD